MNYEKIYTLIALRVPKMLPFFADSWNRFPSDYNAEMIRQNLVKKAEYYQNRNKPLSDDLFNAANEIKTRANI